MATQNTVEMLLFNEATFWEPLFSKVPYFFKVVISYLKSYFWVVPSLLSEDTCSDLVFSKVLCFFLNKYFQSSLFQRYWIILNSSCDHSYYEWPFFKCKRAIAALHSAIYSKFAAIYILGNILCFCRTEILARNVIVADCETWFQVWIYWQESVIWRHQLQSFIFSMVASSQLAFTSSESTIEKLKQGVTYVQS